MSQMMYHMAPRAFLVENTHSIIYERCYEAEIVRISRKRDMMNQAEIARRNPTPAAIMPFFALSTHELSPVIPEASCMRTAKYMSMRMAIVPAIPMMNSIKKAIIFGIVSMSTFQARRSEFSCQRIFGVDATCELELLFC